MKFKNTFVIVLLIVGISCSSTYSAEIPSKKAYYINITLNKQSVMPTLIKLQRNVRSFLVDQGLLQNIGLGDSAGYVYKNTNFRQFDPHISLLRIPSYMSKEEVIALSKSILKNYPGKLPTLFSFKNVQAFLPGERSDKLFIIARASSNVPYGFFKLSQYLETNLGIERSQSMFLGHITLAHIKSTGFNHFTAEQVEMLNEALKQFSLLPVGEFPLNDFVFSEHGGTLYSLTSSPN